MYNEKDDQIFIKLPKDEQLTEFLLDKQPLEFIRAGIVTKDEIRETVENGRQDKPDVYAKVFAMQDYNIAMNVTVKIDGFFRIIENVEKLYF